MDKLKIFNILEDLKYTETFELRKNLYELLSAEERIYLLDQLVQKFGKELIINWKQ